MKKVNEKKFKSKLTYIFKTYNIPPVIRVKICEAFMKSIIEDEENSTSNWPF